MFRNIFEVIFVVRRNTKPLENFKALSLSYKNTPLDIRELIALNEESCKSLLIKIKEFTDTTDVLVLSTCNRTEVYYSSNNDYSNDIIKLIGIEKGIQNITKHKDLFIEISDSKEAIQHLFDVCIGLESQVVGDMQITNQVKNAYQWSADLEMAGPFLHRLMHTIFFTNKKVVQETPFRDGAASVSYAAVELISELTSVIREPKVLVLGLGEMGEDITKNLLNTDIKNVKIINRTVSKAEELAKTCGFEFGDIDNLWDDIQNADVIVSSVSKEEPIISKTDAEKLNILSFKYFIDIAVPRSVEPSVDKIPGAIVYNVDKINNRANKALEKRKNSVPQVRSIISEAIVEFNDWSKEMEVSPTIQKLKNALEDIRKQEIDRYVKDLSNEESEKVELITKNIMQKIIKLPVLQLKAACKRGEAETLIDVLNDLFNLEKEEIEA